MVGDTVNLAFVVLFAPDFGNEVATFWVAVATTDAKDSAIANVRAQRGRQCFILVVMQYDISLIVSSLSLKHSDLRIKCTSSVSVSYCYRDQLISLVISLVQS